LKSKNHIKIFYQKILYLQYDTRKDSRGSVGNIFLQLSLYHMKKETQKDLVYAIAKAGLGSIPILGAAAGELFQLLVMPPLEKRRNEWMTEVGEKLKDLEESNNLDLEKLQENEIFIDVVTQATQLALRTSEKEKLEYLKNAVLNTAVEENPDITEIQIFLNFVADFTTWHVKILKLFDNPTEWYRANNKTPKDYFSAGLSNVLLDAYPELNGRGEIYNLIWKDLERAGFHRTSDLQSSMTGAGLMQQRTTEFGKRFLEFVTENP